MANPRKFSEKIAIQRQKQAEETAAFEQIMRDVITATRGSNHASSSINKNQQHLHINPSVGNCRAESLPDVNRIGVSPEQSSIDLKSCLNILDDMRRGRDPIRRHPSPNASSRSPHRHHISGGHHRSSYNEQRRGDSSPYSPVYLSPPMDTNWRRTNSDSALHQTGLVAEQLGACSPLHQPGSPLSPVGPHSGASSPRRSTVHTVETTSSTNAIYTVASTPSPNSSEYNTVTNSNLGAGGNQPQQLHMNPDNLQDVTNGMSFTANGNTIITSNIESNLQQQQQQQQQQGERDSQSSDIHHQQQQLHHHQPQQQQQQQQQQLLQNGNYNEHIRDSTIYLSPLPMDSSNWRRANSDSRLHQTVMMADQMDSSNSPLQHHHHHHHQSHLDHLNHHNHHHQQQQQQQQQQPSSQQLLNELASSRRSPAQTIGTNNIFGGTTTSLTSNNNHNSNTNGQDLIDPSSYPSTFPAHNSWDPGKKINSLNHPNFNLLPASLPNVIDSRPKSTGGVPGIKIETLDENNVNNNNVNNIHHQQHHLQNHHLNHQQHHHQQQQHGHHHHHQPQQHPSFANTGSLPDLTNIPFTTSLPAAIDLDEASLSPVTHIMANTMLTDTYPNASPSPGSPYDCVSSTSSISYANQSTNNYSSSPSSSASFVQQSTIFTQSTFASHNETNNSTNSNNHDNHNNTNHTTNTNANNTNNLITSNINTHTNTATNTETTSNIPTDVLVSNQDFSKGNGSTIILPTSNPDLSELFSSSNEEAFRQSLDPMTSIDFEDLQLLTAEFT